MNIVSRFIKVHALAREVEHDPMDLSLAHLPAILPLKLMGGREVEAKTQHDETISVRELFLAMVGDITKETFIIPLREGAFLSRDGAKLKLTDRECRILLNAAERRKSHSSGMPAKASA